MQFFLICFSLCIIFSRRPFSPAEYAFFQRITVITYNWIYTELNWIFSSVIPRTSIIHGRETPNAWAKISRPFISFLTYSICCWNFGCRFGPPFCMGLFYFFLNWTPQPLWEGLKPPQNFPIFKHFLIDLECWNFGCGLRPLFCIRIFFFFLIGPLCLPWGPQKVFCPKKLNSSYIGRF